MAALELDILSAGRSHGELLGRPTALHLFSSGLPFRRIASAWLSEQKTASEQDAFLDELQSWDLTQAIASLREIAGRPSAGEVLGDGSRLGQVTRGEIADPITRASLLGLLCAAYLDQHTGFRPPYFDLVQ